MEKRISGSGVPNFSPDFVVITEDGILHGFDSCGQSVWRADIGRILVNATETYGFESLGTARMVPAIDGSLYVVFPPDSVDLSPRIAHVNASIMSVVAESPFSTPAFPNSYLTGSKIQTFGAVSFSEDFEGWTFGESESLAGRRLLYSVNDWTLSCIDTATQTERWGLSFCELPALTSAHLNPANFEFYQVESLGREVAISTRSNENKVTKAVNSDLCASAGLTSVEILFEEQVLGVYALLDAGDTEGNLSLVLVARNVAVPTNFGGLPDASFASAYEASMELPGVTIAYDSRAYQSSVTPYKYLEIAPPSVRLGLPDFSEVRVVDFLTQKFRLLSVSGKLYLVCMLILSLYVFRRAYVFGRRKFILRQQKNSTENSNSRTTIMLPDGSSFKASVPPEGQRSFTISSPTSSKLVLVHSEAIHPYEVVRVGQGDSVEFAPWQADADRFERKILEISQRLTKLPFAHSARPSLDSGNMTVIFLGRNVDEPKLVFRNPRAETVLQRANVPVHSQSIRNAVASSALRDSPALRAYIPRSVWGTWNSFPGVFQEFVASATAKSSEASEGIGWFRESPAAAVDTAFLITLLRDTDAHDGNYVRDLRRKVALFDLGCALGTEPLPADDRVCLENFEIWKRLPHLLDVPFEARHLEYLEAIDWVGLNETWANFDGPSGAQPHPLEMLRVLRMHANFLRACAAADRTLLFAINLLFSGSYDDLWLELKSVDLLEQKLLQLATDT